MKNMMEEVKREKCIKWSQMYENCCQEAEARPLKNSFNLSVSNISAGSLKPGHGPDV